MKFERLLGWGCLAIVGVMPFHAFLSVWLGHLFGGMSVFQSWKEVLIIAMIAVAGIYIWQKPRLLKQRLTPLTWLVVGYAAINIFFAAIVNNDPFAELIAIKANLGFLAVFLVASLIKDKRYKQIGQNILLGATGVVSLFAILQSTVLPTNFLERFGYGPNTIPPNLPYADLQRFPSTLGGPNQLGAFLILPLALTLKLAIRQKQRWQYLLLGLELMALFFTYSRSAWLGAIAAVAIVAWIEGNMMWRVRLVAGGILAIVAAVALIFATGNRSLLIRGWLEPNSSDAQRISSLQQGSRTIIENPQGLGPGSAGPASFESNKPLITENYYLQLAIEVGLVGLLVFLSTQAIWASQLWQWRSYSGMAGPLIGALAGVSIVNLFLHGWADSSTALTYWTMAGLALGGSKKDV